MSFLKLQKCNLAITSNQCALRSGRWHPEDLLANGPWQLRLLPRVFLINYSSKVERIFETVTHLSNPSPSCVICDVHDQTSGVKVLVWQRDTPLYTTNLRLWICEAEGNTKWWWAVVQPIAEIQRDACVKHMFSETTDSEWERSGYWNMSEYFYSLWLAAALKFSYTSTYVYSGFVDTSEGLTYIYVLLCFMFLHFNIFTSVTSHFGSMTVVQLSSAFDVSLVLRCLHGVTSLLPRAAIVSACGSLWQSCDVATFIHVFIVQVVSRLLHCQDFMF